MRTKLLESAAKEITLKDDDPDALEGMFKHMYNIDPQPFEEHNYDPEVDAKQLTADRVLYCIELFRVADKYNCASLLEAAPDMFHREFFKTTREMADHVFDFHKIHGHDSLSHERRIAWGKRCAVPADTLREIAEAVYELQDSWIQEGRSPITSDFVAQFFSYHEISPITQGVCIEAVFKVAKVVPELGRDLFMEIMDRRGNPMALVTKAGWTMCSRFECPSCDQIYLSPGIHQPRYCRLCGHKSR